MPSKEKTPIHLVMIVDSGGCAHAQCHQTGDEAEQLGEHGCHRQSGPDCHHWNTVSCDQPRTGPNSNENRFLLLPKMCLPPLLSVPS